MNLESASQVGSDCLKIRVLRSISDAEEMRPLWNQWSMHPNADLDFYALSAGLKGSTARPLCLVVLRNDVPVAILPGIADNSKMEVRFGYFRLMKLGASRLAFGALMGESSPGIAQTLVSAIASLLKSEAYDVAEIGYIPIDSDTYRAAKKTATFLVRGHVRQLNPHWRMHVPATMEAFFASRNKKSRYWLKRISRVLEKDFPGNVRIAHFHHEGEISEFARGAEEVAGKTYQRRIGVGFFDNEEYRQRLALAARRNWLHAYILYIEEKPRAFWAGSLYKGVFFLAWTGYDPALRKYELGTIVLLRLIEDLTAQGAREIDFGYGTAPYKERFGDQNWVDDVAVLFAPTIRGGSLNLLLSASSYFSRGLRLLLKGANLEQWLRRVWRRKLTDS